jgi:predicted ATP-grasp superfamily ATP-dependent carboligase
VVVGLDSTQGLQTARILAKRNVPVIGIVTNPGYFASKTGVCREILVAKTSKPVVIEALADLGRRLEQRAVVIPCLDMAVKQISDNRESLAEWYHINLPRRELVDLLIDKVAFYEYAASNNLPIPRTVILQSATDVEQAADTLAFPCILKPPWRPGAWVRNTKSKGFLIQSADDLAQAFERYSEWADALIAQDWIPGGDDHHYTCNAYFDSDSQPLVAYVSQKLRQWEPVTGRACLAIEARNDVVLETTISLFRSLSYTGLAYLEMKRHAETGEHLIIEPNVGRPTGRAAMAEASGVEFMATMYCDTLGLSLPDRREQQYTGLKWIHFLRDLQASWHHWRSGTLSVGDWLRSLRGRKAFAVFSVRDPLPFFHAMLAGVWSLRSERVFRREEG